MKAQRGNWGPISTIFLTSTLDGVGGQRQAPVALPPGKKPGTHYTEPWVGSRARLDGCRICRANHDPIPGPWKVAIPTKLFP